MNKKEWNKDIIKRLEQFWDSVDSTFAGEWNQGISQDDWKLLDDVKQQLS